MKLTVQEKVSRISSMVPTSKQLNVKYSFGIIDCFCNWIKEPLDSGTLRLHHRQRLCDQSLNGSTERSVSHLYVFDFFRVWTRLDIRSAPAYHCNTFVTELSVGGDLSWVNFIYIKSQTWWGKKSRGKLPEEQYLLVRTDRRGLGKTKVYLQYF